MYSKNGIPWVRPPTQDRQPLHLPHIRLSLPEAEHRRQIPQQYGFFFFFAPKQLETITPMPEESPIHNEKNKKLIMPTEPTAP